MKKLTYVFLTLFILGGVIVACNNDDDEQPTDDVAATDDDQGTSDDDAGTTDDDGGTSVTAAEVVANYADIVYQNYLDSYNAAVTMQTAIDAFVDAPTEELLTAAKEAWLAAREPYGQSEAYRFANGPIDTGGETWSLDNEGQMNAWPLDESYIDYVAEETGYTGDFNGIVSDTDFEITEETIAAANEGGAIENEKAISAGWHAIEFLLWGQDNTDPSQKIPGQRPLTDYTTADNAARRGDYLKVVTALLVADLNDLVTTWAEGGTYRTVFEALSPEVALQQAVYGAFGMAGFEVARERMIAAVDSTDGIDNSGQEDEHSCFSDNTHRDMFLNVQGIINVLSGSYGDLSGASFITLVTEADATQGAALQAAVDDALAKATAISTLATDMDQPFDFLITQETTENPGPVTEAAQSLITLSDEITASATVLGIDLGGLPE